MGRDMDSNVSLDTLYSDKCFVMILDCYLKLVSPVGIATRYGVNGPGTESRWGRDLLHPFLIGHGAHPASRTTVTGSFPGIKQPRRGVVHPPHLTPRLKKE